MATILSFDWGNFDNRHITEDEDPAYAGDKIPDSKDDIPCGDGWIPREKDCHDGDAHRPSPGENPYWTDENSAERRNERDVPWDTNKPKSREERDEETDWRKPDEKVPETPEEAPVEEEPKKVSQDTLENIPDGQWDKAQSGLHDGLIDTTTFYSNYKGISSPEAISLMDMVNELKQADREEAVNIANSLQGILNQTKEDIKGSSVFEMGMKKAQFAIDNLQGMVQPQDPRDIMVWDKISNRPETLEVEDLLQISKLRNIDPDNMTPKDEQQSKRQVTVLTSLLSKWREAPTVGGEYLAKQFFSPPQQRGWAAVGYDQIIDESPFETNPKLALAILDRSARAGDHLSNRDLWKNFGLSEEWHPTSFLFDHEKAATKATKELAQMADWSDVDAADREMMLIGVDLAEAEEALAVQVNITGNAMDALLDKRDTEGISVKEYKETLRKIEKAHQPIEEAFWDARKRLKAAEKRLIEHADKVRHQVKESLKKLNVNTQVDTDIAGNILHKLGNARWSELDEADEEYKIEEGHGPGGLSGRRLFTLRRKNRDTQGNYPDAKNIVEHMQDFFSICHKDLLGAPALQDIDWESEIFERAYANMETNTICLNVHPEKMPKSVEYQRAKKARDTAADRPDVAIHEFAHHLEVRNPDIANRILDFYERRTKDQRVIKKGDKKPDGTLYSELGHYDENESFKDDHFFDIYCGKIYGSRKEMEATGRSGLPTTELISMGMQAFYNKAQWGMLVRTDREHLALIIACLRGY